MEKLKRNTLKKLLVLLVSFIAKVSYSNGNPYRDRFQSYRQTFRIEPNPIETERIINNIIGEKKITKNLVDLQVPDTVEDGNVVPLTFKINCSMKKDDYPKKVHEHQFFFLSYKILFLKFYYYHTKFFQFLLFYR